MLTMAINHRAANSTCNLTCCICFLEQLSVKLNLMRNLQNLVFKPDTPLEMCMQKLENTTVGHHALSLLCGLPCDYKSITATLQCGLAFIREVLNSNYVLQRATKKQSLMFQQQRSAFAASNKNVHFQNNEKSPHQRHTPDFKKIFLKTIYLINKIVTELSFLEVWRVGGPCSETKRPDYLLPDNCCSHLTGTAYVFQVFNTYLHKGQIHTVMERIK